MDQILLEDILKLVELQFGQLGIKANDRLAEDLGAESAEVMYIVAAVEDRYGVVLKESEIARIHTPKDLFDIVQQKTHDV